jgi:hypothetical protein
VVLDGDGVHKPRCSRNNPNLGTVAVGGEATKLEFAEATGQVRQQKEDSGAIVFYPQRDSVGSTGPLTRRTNGSAFPCSSKGCRGCR